MVDMAKCFGGDCPLKGKCFRFTAPAGEFRQSYFKNPMNLGENCKYFVSNGSKNGNVE